MSASIFDAANHYLGVGVGEHLGYLFTGIWTLLISAMIVQDRRILALSGAAISLAVAGILVMNVMLMSVKQRTAEIGLLKALGAPATQVRTLFLTEAGLIATAGAVVGMVVGKVIVIIGRQVYPSVPFATPGWALWSSLGLAVGTALLFAWLPAQQAADMEPVDALGRK